MTEIEFHPSARAELDASVDFYESRLQGLGIGFLAAVEETTERIPPRPVRALHWLEDFANDWLLAFRSTSPTELGMSTCFLLPSLTNTDDLGTGVGAPAVANTLERPGLNVETSREGLCTGRSSAAVPAD